MGYSGTLELERGPGGIQGHSGILEPVGLEGHSEILEPESWPPYGWLRFLCAACNAVLCLSLIEIKVSLKILKYLPGHLIFYKPHVTF